MKKQQDISTVKDTEVHQAHNAPQDLECELENGKWYFIDESYGYIGPYETSDEAKQALLRYIQYIGE